MKKCRIISKTLFTTLTILICLLTPCIASSETQARSGGFGKFLLIMIGFGLAFFIIYMSYRADKREEMHLKKVSMVQEKKTKINKKQIENMIGTFMKNGTKEIKDRIMSIKDNIGKDFDEEDDEDYEIEEEVASNDVGENRKIEEEEIIENVEELDMDDVLLDAIDIEDINDIEDVEILENNENALEIDVEEEPEENEGATIIEELPREVDDNEIVSIDFEEVERDGLETPSSDVVAGIVKGYDYEENIEDIEDIEEFLSTEEQTIDTDENSEVDDLLEIILPKRYTRKKTNIQPKKMIKKYTRKKDKKKSKKSNVKRFYSTGRKLSKKNSVVEEVDEQFEDNAGIEIEELTNTNEYVDYKELLDIIDPKAKNGKKDVEVVTIDRSEIEPFMPKREPLKKGRGRPKKEITEEKPKRGRGRPKKEITEEKPKRGRGRPRKDS